MTLKEYFAVPFPDGLAKVRMYGPGHFICTQGGCVWKLCHSDPVDNMKGLMEHYRQFHAGTDA